MNSEVEQSNYPSYDDVVAVQPILQPTTLSIYINYRYSNNSGGRKKIKKKITPEEVNWVKEGF
jgi:hypothetical protein